MVSKLGAALLGAFIALLASSGIWLTAYFVAVKPQQDKPSSPPPIIPKWEKAVCSKPCSYELVESLPIGLYDGEKVKRLKSTYNAWNELLESAEKSVDMIAFYWSLLEKDTGPGGNKYDNSTEEGRLIYEKIISTAKKGIKVRVAQDGKKFPESDYLAKENLAEVRSVNFKELLGYGVLHTKGWIVDEKHFYLGSANHDWRALTQVKEIGVLVKDCPCLARDLANIFEIYFELGLPGKKVPKSWSEDYSTGFNHSHPIVTRLGNDNSVVHFTSSPPELVPPFREHDSASIIRTINEAKRYIYISVMDYAPVTFYQTPNNVYWPEIDNALRHAAYDRHVVVRLLMSKWETTRWSIFNYLHSLHDLDVGLPKGCPPNVSKCTPYKGALEVKIFEVPPYRIKVPYARVNHAKYMVTEEVATVCTSNWAADYFLNTAGSSIVVRSENEGTETSLVKDLREIFERDWNSDYATSIEEFDINGHRINKTLEEMWN